MTHALIVIGSARTGRVADTVARYTQEEATGIDGLDTTIVDLAALNLPFFDNERAPADPAYEISHPEVAQWARTVADADVVIFITPEYNHTLSAIQKNAIDSLGKEWVEKPVAVVTYGWYAGANALAAIRELAPVIKIDLKQAPAQLGFKQDIDVDGSFIDEAGTREKIRTALSELV